MARDVPQVQRASGGTQWYSAGAQNGSFASKPATGARAVDGHRTINGVTRTYVQAPRWCPAMPPEGHNEDALRSTPSARMGCRECRAGKDENSLSAELLRNFAVAEQQAAALRRQPPPTVNRLTSLTQER